MDLNNGEQAPIVTLATNLLEDISELCTQMATINRCEILFEAEVRRAVDEGDEERSRKPAGHS